MKANLVPVFINSIDEDFRIQTKILENLLSDVAHIYEPIALNSKLPEADAVIFPQLTGDAFKNIKAIKNISLPIIVATSEFGTVNMWDWEIVSFMKSEGLKVFAPYDVKLTKIICKGLALKRENKKTNFLVYQDSPGTGDMFPHIFRRFYWWEDQFVDLLKKRFGISIIKKSYKELGSRVKEISDKDAEKVLKNWDIATEKTTDKALKSAVKLYMGIKEDIEREPNIKGVGINCLNESYYSDTTPCLAWNMLYEEKKIIWACEGDILSLLTMYIINKSLDVPIMMSNVYPFLMGLAALKHEKIDKFPEVNEPENHLLVVHCGYFGFVPKPFCTEWKLRPKVLSIVDENATVVDAKMPEGDITIAKLDLTLSKLLAIKGNIEGYVQYPGSDCRNGALIAVRDGYKLMNEFDSHHNCIISGYKGVELEYLTKIFDLKLTLL